jgi:hypothetical protein
MSRVLDAFELAKNGRGRRAYVEWLEARAMTHGGEIDDTAMAALRRGWYLGDLTFAEQLRTLVERGGGRLVVRDPTARNLLFKRSGREYYAWRR